MGKICYTCKEEKDISLFKKNVRSKDGYCYKCKACCSIADPELKKLKESKELLLAKGIKVCHACKAEKPIGEFLLKRNGKYHSWCNDCRKIKKKEWDESHEEHRAKYREDNKDHINQRNAEYNLAHYEERKEKWTIDNEKLKEKRKQDRLKPENREREKKRGKEWRENNRQHTQSYMKEYYDKNESKKIGRNLRGRLRKVLKGTMRSLHTKNIAGCSLEFLKTHIESQFTEGMSWNNYPKWHIDHYLPCNAFQLNLPLHQKACFFWLNLRPMWGAENISKNDNYFIEEFDAYMEWFADKIGDK